MHAADLALILQERHYKVKQHGKEWRAQCPAHGGEDLNLAITDGERAVVCTCHSHQCEVGEIAAALGIEVGELWFQPRDSPNGGKPEPRVFPYRDEHGAPLFEVVRIEAHAGQKKQFLMRLPGAARFGVGNVRRVLFGLPELLSSGPGEVVAIAEGEKCALAVALTGIRATTNPNGAGQWREEYTAWLKEHLADRRFLVLADNDTEGKKHALAVCDSLKAAGLKVWLADLGSLPDKGDVVDWIGKGGTAEDLRAMAADAPHPLDLRVMEGDQLDRAELPEPEAIVPHLFYRGFSTLLAGDSKLGKSSLLLKAMLASACGGWWLDRERRAENRLSEARILFINFEDPLFVTRDRARRMMAPEGLPKNFLTIDPPYGYTLAQVLDWLHGCYERLRLDAVVLDPIAIAAEWADEADNAEVARTFKLIQQLAAETMLALLSAHHVTKKPGAYGLNIRGASAIKANVLGYLVLERDKSLFKLSGINKLAGEWDVTLDRTDQDWSWWIVETRSGSTRTTRQARKEEALADLLSLVGEAPLIATERLAELLDMNYRTCLRYLQDLEAWGHVAHHDLPGGGQGGRPKMGWIRLAAPEEGS